MNPAEIFINQHGRARSGWRFAVFLIALLALLSVIGGIGGAVIFYLPIGFSENSLLAFGLHRERHIFNVAPTKLELFFGNSSYKYAFLTEL